MSLDGKVRRRLQQALAVVDEHGTTGPRLVQDAKRVWARVQKLIRMNVLATDPDIEALELACHAMQLPQKQTRMAIGKLGRTNLRQRAENAAEMLINVIGEDVDESLLDRTARLLHETPQKQPMLEEARLLADAINLDDFGSVGLLALAMQLSLLGDGPGELADACAKRDEYGYWEARLKDGFHFDVVRKMAQQRLQAAREVTRTLVDELSEGAL
ncbi:MAG: hypothetical protein ACREJC_22115 [Tepidisphaeraceae bacterium]